MKEENEITKKFMELLGFEFVTVNYVGDDDETEWQKLNKDWMFEVEINDVGDYFVDVENYEYYHLYGDWSETISFKTDWDWLMKVIVKLGIKNVIPDIKIMYTRCYQELIAKRLIELNEKDIKSYPEGWSIFY